MPVSYAREDICISNSYVIKMLLAASMPLKKALYSQLLAAIGLYLYKTIIIIPGMSVANIHISWLR